MKQFSLEEYLSNPNLPVITRDGHKARIICTDCKDSCSAGNPLPVVALIQWGHDEYLCRYTVGGSISRDDVDLLDYGDDLFFDVEPSKAYVNVYYDRDLQRPWLGLVCSSLQEAEAGITNRDSYIKTIEIEYYK